MSAVGTMIPWWQHRILERVGKALGLRLGRKHYFTTILVQRAVIELLDRLKADPVHGEAIRAICREEMERTERGRRHRVLGMIPTGDASHYSLAYLVGDEAADILYEFARLNRRDEFEAMLRAITDASIFRTEGVWATVRNRLGRLKPRSAREQ